MERRVTTTGSGAAEGVPDAVTVHLAAVAEAATVSAALEKVALNAGAVITITRETQPDATTTSAGLQVWPRTDAQGRPAGFEARHALALRCPRLDDAGPLVDVIAGAVGEALRVDGVDLVLTDPAPLEAQARERAFGHARAKAEQYAELAGLRLAEVVAVEESLGAPVRPYAARLEALASTTFEPGTTTVTASVTVTWAGVPR